MATRIDQDKLEQYIGELNSLQLKWSSYKKTPSDQGENGGGAVTEMVEMTESLQNMQDAFIQLLTNTLSYMRQRKKSVEAKDAEAATKIKK